MSANHIRRLAIIGGTHGNEFTGAYLVKKLKRFPNLVKRSSFETTTLLANPQAFAVARRYVDRDLNRCFSIKDLGNPQCSSYEDKQAKVIHQVLATEENSKVDAIFDLHSTTANMGLTIIPVSDRPFNLQLAAYLSSIDPTIKVYQWQQSHDRCFLRSRFELGLTIEVGPIAQGVLNAWFFEQTEKLLCTILDYIEAYNRGQAPTAPSQLTIYRCTEIIDYPRDEEGIQAMIHPELQFKDYAPLNPGDPLFLNFEGKTIFYEGESTVYPVFINEAAYYEKGIAVCLTKKEQIPIKSFTQLEKSF